MSAEPEPSALPVEQPSAPRVAVPPEWRNCRFCGSEAVTLPRVRVVRGVDEHQVCCQACGARGPVHRDRNAAAGLWMVMGRELPQPAVVAEPEPPAEAPVAPAPRPSLIGLLGALRRG